MVPRIEWVGGHGHEDVDEDGSEDGEGMIRSSYTYAYQLELVPE